MQANGEVEPAKAVLDKALEADPTNARVHHGGVCWSALLWYVLFVALALHYDDNDNTELAMKHYLEAIRWLIFVSFVITSTSL